MEAGGWIDTGGMAGPGLRAPSFSSLPQPCESWVSLEWRGSARWVTPHFVAEKSILYTELLARLLFFATSHPAMIGQLCQQAQSWFRACPYPMLVPLAGFLQPPGGPLRATLTGCHKGECPRHHKTHTSSLRNQEPRCQVFGLLSGAPLCKAGGLTQSATGTFPCHLMLTRLSVSPGTVACCCKYC